MWQKQMKSWRQSNQGKCDWRKRQIQRAAGDHSCRRRYAFAAVLAVEALLLIPRTFRERGIVFRMMQCEEICQIEWVFPQNSLENTYGLRFCPGTWELQFYHRQELDSDRQ